MASTAQDHLCRLCRTTNLVASIAQIPEDCQRYGSRFFERSYFVSLDDLIRSADECVWCKEITAPLTMPDIKDCSDKIKYRVDLTFCCSSCRHATHFDRFRYTVHRFENDDLTRCGSSYEGRLHFLNRTPELIAAERSSRLQSMTGTAKTWLEQCKQNHDTCDNKDTVSFPTRLIDVRSEGNGCIRLHVPGATGKGSYAALSYCWGGTYNFMTTTENIASHLVSIREDDLPLTVKQAVEFTRRLNVDYLWVDAICIIQDSKEDKKREIRNMRNIFKNSYVTLVASHPLSVSDGFLFPQSTPMSTFFNVSFGALTNGEHDISVELLPFSRIRHQPVNKRAWTLEERLLSGKLLIFSSYGLFWQCEQENLAYEEALLEDQDKNQIGYRIDIHISSLLNTNEERFFSSVVVRWHTLVSDYTSRGLSHFRDKLPAIAGIAEEFSHNWGSRLGEYKAGLWPNYLVDSLAWQASRGWCTEPLKKYRAPSWSWAALDSQVATFPGSRNNKADHDRRAKIVDVQVKTVNEDDPFGKIESGFMTV